MSPINQTRLHKLGKRPFFIAALVFTAAFLLYWPALKLPLLFDDLLHIRLVKNLDIVSLWLPSEEFGFYRPFVFLPFLIIKALFGHYPAGLLHGLTVAHHSLNAALLALLVWRLWGGIGRSLAAGLLLAAYPFAYQAVAFYGNAVYPAAAGLILLALHSYLSATQPPGSSKLPGGSSYGRKWLILTAVLFLIGLLTHETMVLFGPLAFLIHWSLLEQPWPNTADQLRAISRKLWPALLFIGLGAAYALLYQLLPTGPGPGLDAGGNAPWPKTLYLLQSAVYPVAWLAHRLPSISANGIILTGLALMLVLTFLTARRPANRPALLAGWLWWALACLLIGLNLPTYYIEHGARLLYLGGTGIVLVWVLLLDWLHERPKIGPLLWLAVLLFIVLSSASFVRGRLAAFTAIASPLEVLEEVFDGHGFLTEDQGILLVNLPAWMSPPRNTYATGVEYVTLMGGHLFAEELIEENLNKNHPVLAVGIPERLTDPGYPYGIHDQAQLDLISAEWASAGSHVFVTDYTKSGPRTTFTGSLLIDPYYPISDLPLARFDPYILANAMADSCDGSISVITSWQTNPQFPTPDPQASTRSVFVQALDENGQLIAQADGPPLGIRPDRLDLPADWGMVDRRVIKADGAARILIGVYDSLTGDRYSAVDYWRRPLPDNALPLPITPCQN